MNNLSWMLYAADVAGALSVAAFAVSLLATFGGAVTVFCSYTEGDKKIAKLGTKVLAGAAAGWLVFAVIPSRDTVYAIALSEMGEEVLHSETGNKAVEALNAWLDRQIEGEDEE